VSGVTIRVAPKCLRGVTAERGYLGVVAKFLGFLLGVAVALAGPAVFGVLAAPGGVELNTKGMALAFGIGALIFWAVVSYFSGAGALGAFVAFGTLIYCWLWIPNRTTNFLNDVPGVTNGMIDGSKQYTLNGVVPILGVISLVYAIQLIVHGVQRRRRERADADRLQREQEAAQAQQEADVAAVYPVAGGTYQEPAAYESHARYDDLFDEPAPVQPRNQADEQTRQFPVGASEEAEHTRQFPEPDADSNYSGEETVVAAAPVADEPQETPAASTQQESAEQAAPAAEAPAVQQEAAPAREPSAATEEPATQVAPAADPEASRSDEETKSTVDQTQPMATAPKATPPVDETQPMEATPPAVPQATAPAAPAEQVEAEEQKKAERVAAPRVGPQEQVGAQYRERMDNPEDTGEFHLAFENPVVKPA
jgi:hypothetical protein